MVAGRCDEKGIRDSAYCVRTEPATEATVVGVVYWDQPDRGVLIVITGESNGKRKGLSIRQTTADPITTRSRSLQNRRTAPLSVATGQANVPNCHNPSLTFAVGRMTQISRPGRAAALIPIGTDSTANLACVLAINKPSGQAVSGQ